jgi:hypothetical protein
MTYALRVACCLPAHAPTAPIARIIALTAPMRLGLSGTPFHESFHGRGAADSVLGPARCMSSNCGFVAATGADDRRTEADAMFPSGPSPGGLNRGWEGCISRTAAAPSCRSRAARSPPSPGPTRPAARTAPGAKPPPGDQGWRRSWSPSAVSRRVPRSRSSHGASRPDRPRSVRVRDILAAPGQVAADAGSDLPLAAAQPRSPRPWLGEHNTLPPAPAPTRQHPARQRQNVRPKREDRCRSNVMTSWTRRSSRFMGALFIAERSAGVG